MPESSIMRFLMTITRQLRMAEIITWQQLTIYSKQDISDQINIWLNLLDAQAIENSPSGLITKALFLPSIAIDLVKSFLQKNITTDEGLEFSLELIKDNAWHATQNKELEPIEITREIAIYPDNYQGEQNHEKPIYIQAINAFGTGAHPTTYQCLQWLARQDLESKQIIDFGCGSGVLGITALVLGAQNIQAIDIDLKALEITKRNAQVNQLDLKKFTLGTELKTKQNFKADLIVANLFANPLCELVELFSQYLSFNGEILLAGMLIEQMPQVIASYEKYFSINKINELDGWPVLHAKKKA